MDLSIFNALIPFLPLVLIGVAGFIVGWAYWATLWRSPMLNPFVIVALLVAVGIAAVSGAAFAPIALMLGTMVALAAYAGSAVAGFALPFAIFFGSIAIEEFFENLGRAFARLQSR